MKFKMVKESTEEEKIEESRELLEKYKKHYARSLNYHISRVSEIEKQMARKKTKSWDPKKKQKMVRRLINAQTMVNQIEPILNQVQVRLEQISGGND